MRLLPALALLLLSGCALENLLWPGPPPVEKRCSWDAYYTTSATITSGDSTWVVRDTVWLGSVNVECPKGGK